MELATGIEKYYCGNSNGLGFYNVDFSWKTTAAMKNPIPGIQDVPWVGKDKETLRQDHGNQLQATSIYCLWET